MLCDVTSLTSVLDSSRCKRVVDECQESKRSVNFYSHISEEIESVLTSFVTRYI